MIDHRIRTCVQNHVKKPTNDNQSTSEAEDQPAAEPAPQRRRRQRQRRVPDSTVPSPCIAVCQYNQENLCAGCFRTPDEIRDWMIMSREEKLAVWADLKSRRQNCFK